MSSEAVATPSLSAYTV